MPTPRTRILATAAVMLVSAAARGQGLPEGARVRVSAVDAADPTSWRLRLSAVDEAGKAVPLADHDVALFVGEGAGRVRTQGADPWVRFAAGSVEKGFKGTLAPIAKAKDVRQAVVFVVALHSGVPVEEIEPIRKALDAVLDELRKDARVGVVFYGDTLQVLWSPDGARSDVRDVDDFQHCLADLREAAGRSAPPEPGAVPCGRLFDGPAAVKSLLKVLPARQGLFPRLLGIPEPADVMDAAHRKGHDRLDAPLAAEGPGRERFAAGAVEAAARLLEVAAPAGAARDVVLISDGQDGYLRLPELAHAAAVRKCGGSASACRSAAGKASAASAEEGGSRECVAAALECSIPKVADARVAREGVVREVLGSLVATAAASGVRVFPIAMPGTDDVGRARLAALAARTGGTLRSAPNAPSISVVAGQLAAEIASEVVVTPGKSLDASRRYQVVAVVDRELKSDAFAFTTGPRPWPLQGRVAGLRSLAIGKLGHAWGPPVFLIAAVLAALVAIGLVLTLGRAVVGLAKKLGAPKVPKPKIQRPAVPKPGVPRIPKVK
jgi:hypothetical protein